jgi:hypothetical protein
MHRTVHRNRVSRAFARALSSRPDSDLPRDAKIAVLIDAENTPVKYVPKLFDEISKLGVAVVKRAYGDFSQPSIHKWRDAALTYAISTEQQFAYTRGKNATDIRLTIDAMDLLHSPQYCIDDFVIVSSDSDFAPLASRLRMAGTGQVIGAGSSRTPAGFVNAVEHWINLDEIGDEESADESIMEFATILQEAVALLAFTSENHALSHYSESEGVADGAEDGWVYLRSAGRVIGRRHPGFKANLRAHGTASRAPAICTMRGVASITQLTPPPPPAHPFLRRQKAEGRRRRGRVPGGEARREGSVQRAFQRHSGAGVAQDRAVLRLRRSPAG